MSGRETMTGGRSVSRARAGVGLAAFCLAAVLCQACARTDDAAATTPTPDAGDAQQRSRQIISDAEAAHDRAAALSGGAAAQSSSPPPAGGTPVDTSALDADIKRLEATARKNSSDEGARQQLAQAYAARAAKLTGVRQYRAALGDWRRAARLDPANTEAQNMISTITSILQSMNRPVPAPGAEPTPLPVPKQS